jgi:regulator of protease activity HflC (stomatin/prohibitin superfamily)
MSDVPDYHAHVGPGGSNDEPNNHGGHGVAFLGCILGLLLFLGSFYYIIPVVGHKFGIDPPWEPRLPWLIIEADEYVVKEQTPTSAPPAESDTLSKYEKHTFRNHFRLADGAEVKYDIDVTILKTLDVMTIEPKVTDIIRQVLSRYNAESMFHNAAPIVGEILAKLENRFAIDGKSATSVIFGNSTYQLPRSITAQFESEIEAKMRILKAKQHLAIIEAETRVRNAEHEIRLHVDKLDRERQLYNARTKKMVDDILNGKCECPPYN